MQSVFDVSFSVRRTLQKCLVCGLAAVCLSACGSVGASSSAASQSAAPVSSSASLASSAVSSSAPESVCASVSEITSEEKSAEIVYVSQADFPDEYRPTLVLHPDGTFSLTENLLEGMGHYTGTYEQSEETLLCHVEVCDFDDGTGSIAGAQCKEIPFAKQADGSLTLEVYLCGSFENDSFLLQE